VTTILDARLKLWRIWSRIESRLSDAIHHDMLVPKDADLAAKYWDKTFALINQQVFAKEDIAVCENVQSAARSGADSQCLYS